MPRGGGIACLFGGLAAVAAWLYYADNRASAAFLLPVAFAITGYLDDRHGLDARVRLCAQIVGGAALGAAAGGLLGSIVGMVIAPLTVNAVNFMDGVNGITSLVMATWGSVVVVLALQHASSQLGLIGVVAVGTSLGFLPWNFPNAYIFLGDTGSYFLGSLPLVAIPIALDSGIPVHAVLAPLLLYLYDVMATLLRRIVRHEKIMEAHREHVYQRLLREGCLSHAGVSLTVFVLTVAISVSWLMLSTPAALATSLATILSYSISPTVARRVRIGMDEREEP